MRPETLKSLDMSSGDAREAFDAGLIHAEDLVANEGLVIADHVEFALRWARIVATMRLARVVGRLSF